jgi:hypothetical protein
MLLCVPAESHAPANEQPTGGELMLRRKTVRVRGGKGGSQRIIFIVLPQSLVHIDFGLFPVFTFVESCIHLTAALVDLGENRLNLCFVFSCI